LAKIKAIMKAKIMAISEGKPFTDSDCVAILEQESEDEEQEAARKARDAKEREQRSEKRRVGARNLRHSLNIGKGTSAGSSVVQHDNDHAVEGAGDDEDADEEEANGEWEQELELPTTQGQVDGRVQQMMAEYMNQGDIGIFVRSYPKMKAN
jgi:hypothetical protein